MIPYPFRACLRIAGAGSWSSASLYQGTLDISIKLSFYSHPCFLQTTESQRLDRGKSFMLIFQYMKVNIPYNGKYDPAQVRTCEGSAIPIDI